MQQTADKRRGLPSHGVIQPIAYWLVFALLLAIAGFLLFFRLDAAKVEYYDELRHGMNAYEMVDSGDYIVNTYLGEPDFYNCKPPLSLWMVALGYQLFGFNLIGLRFFSALSVLLTIAIIGLWMRRYGRLASLVPMGVLAAVQSLYVFHFGRQGDPDALYQLLYTASMLCMLSSKKNVRFLYGSAVFCGLAFLTKSWHAATIPLTCLLYLICTRRLKELTWKRVALLIGAFLAVVLPWALARYLRDGMAFLSAMFMTDVAERVSGEAITGWGYLAKYLGVLFSQPVVAYSLAAAALLWLVSKKDFGEQKNDLVGMLLWFLVPLVVFSCIPAQLFWYVFACVIAAPVLLGFLLQHSWTQASFRWIGPLALACTLLVAGWGDVQSYQYIQSVENTDPYQNPMMALFDREAYMGTHVYIQYNETGDDGAKISAWIPDDLYIARMFGDVACLDGGVEAFWEDEAEAMIFLGTQNNQEEMNALYETGILIEESASVAVFIKE